MKLQNRYIYTALLFVMNVNLLQAAAEEQTPVIAWGASARQGRRSAMEDAHTAMLNFNGDINQAFFGIYDGHGGASAAQAAAHESWTKPLHIFLAESKANTLAEQYKEAFQKTEETLIVIDDAGTTAITAHVDTKIKTVTLAHVGDSRALLVRGNTFVATTDHKPSEPLEKKRILAAGGNITNHGSVTRINGITSFARALGDREIKTGYLKSKGLIATPEINSASYEEEENVVLILACDGVYDVLSNEEAATAVTASLNTCAVKMVSLLNGELEETTGNNAAATLAAYTLRNLAYDRGSKDNISVLVAVLNKTIQPFATEFVAGEPLQKLYGAPIELTPTADTDSDFSFSI